MIKWIVGRAGCFAGRHLRSQRHAAKVAGADQYTSKCAYCGVPMRRLSKRNWVVDRAK